MESSPAGVWGPSLCIFFFFWHKNEVKLELEHNVLRQNEPSVPSHPHLLTYLMNAAAPGAKNSCDPGGHGNSTGLPSRVACVSLLAECGREGTGSCHFTSTPL